jgi:hypothetical protein
MRGRAFKDLLPREVYDVDDTGYWKRMPVAMGLCFGVSMSLVFIALVPRGNAALRVLVGLAGGAIAGVLLSVAFPRLFRRKMRAFTDRLFAGDPELVPVPPAAKGLSHRLICDWMLPSGFAVGGVLYLGRDGLLFVPHLKNLKRDQAILNMGSSDQIQLTLVQPNINVVQRMLIPNPPRYLEVTGNGRRECFLVPQPERVIELVRRCLQE